MIFWLVLKLEISYYRVIIISWRILAFFKKNLRGFFEDYIFAWWNIWVFLTLFFCLKILFNVNGKATVCVTHPLLMDLSQAHKQATTLFFQKKKIPHERISGSPPILINILTLFNFMHQIFIHLVSISKTKLKIRSHSHSVLTSNQPNMRNFQTQFLCSNLKHENNNIT
jgi:hypothetical protein